MNSVHCNNVIRHALSGKFSRIFALSLSRFFTNGDGFNVADFGHTLFGEVEALDERVLGSYGPEGVALVRKLMAAEPLTDDEKDVAASSLGRYYVASVSGFHERAFTSA